MSTRLGRWGGLVSIIVVTAGLSSCSRALGDPPAARRSDHVDLYHGTAVADPYRWLEGAESDEAHEWVEVQDRYARDLVDGWPERDEIRNRIRAGARHTRYLPPVERGGRYFFLQVDPSFTRLSLLVAEDVGGADRVLIKADSLAEHGQLLERIVWPSPDGNRVALAVGQLGSRWMTAHVLDVAAGEMLADSIHGLVGGLSSISWDEDGSGFFYDRFENPAGGDSLTAPIRREQVFYHELGTPQAEDQEVMASPDPDNVFLTHQITDDHGLLVITARHGANATDAVYVKHVDVPAESPGLLIADNLGAFTFVGNAGSKLWLYTTLDAPNGRVVVVDANTSSESPVLTDLIAEGEIPFDVWTPNGTRAVGSRIIAALRQDSRLLVRLFDENGRPAGEVGLPYLGSIWSGFLGNQNSDEVFYVLSGFADPGTVYRLDLKTGQSSVFRRPELPFDPDAFVIRQVFYSGPAGDRIPMYVGHHRDVTPDGTRPVMLYGYGFGSWSAAPWYRAHMAEWMRSGGVFALPALRGGGEYGESWHEAGIRHSRQNAIDDYIASAEWLVQQGMATPERLVAETNSAGGSLVAAAVNQRPDLFGAMILGFPVLDMLRYDEFTGAARWRSEFGSPADSADFATLLAYSPVHNLERGTCYPPTMVTPGSRDETTPPLHAFKFVAAAQYAQDCANPILLRVSWNAGHRYGEDLEKTVDNFTDQLSFLFMVLGK